ncbi:cuticle protein 10.9-like [Daphnia magna]|uniref:Cuticle protein n=1 Tax=Daphnia magna TaxID=35525 RepID=A0ABQ9ZMP3_9CRUS|nr:cuticle protein 10.9 [Daphnia magna]XP_045036006.1 cuticle protein 10.9-like [Daphnia magna]KAK4014219.1 hypothetical protein OUZ56_026751 [Daphnia magna]
MKLIVLAVLVAVATANSYKPAEYAPKYEESTYPAQPYSFGYDVKDKETYTDFEHAEKADGKVTSGSYRVDLPDGRKQTVTYKADDKGYNADVQFEGEAQYPEYTPPKYAKASPYTPVYSSPVYNAPAYAGLSFPAYKTPTYPAFPLI